jgi:hypothetical protein
MNIDEESKKAALIKDEERQARYAPSARWDAIQAGLARIRANESQEYKAAREAAYAQARRNLGLS